MVNCVEHLLKCVDMGDPMWSKTIQNGNLADITLYSTLMNVEFLGEHGYSAATYDQLESFIRVITEHLDFTGLDYVRDVYERVLNLGIRYQHHIQRCQIDVRKVDFVLCRAVPTPPPIDLPGFDLECDGMSYRDYDAWFKACRLEYEFDFGGVLRDQAGLCLDVLGGCYTDLQVKEINREHGGGIPRYFLPSTSVPSCSLPTISNVD